jgi:hypothetical protein
MASYAEALQALEAYRGTLLEGQLNESVTASVLSTRGTAAFARKAPLNNVHATGVGLRTKNGKISGKAFVIKVYVFDKRDLGVNTPELTSKTFDGVQIDVERLPIQDAQATKKAAGGAASQTTPAQHQARHRPLQGGIQIAPSGVNFVGTLGGIVRRGDEFFILSNNHVLADSNNLPIGRRIGQPAGAPASNLVARLSDFEPIRFPATDVAPRNRMDAAIAILDDTNLTTVPGRIFGLPNYVAQIGTPVPGMAVTKSGRTTGVTRGRVVATNVNGVLVNYGTEQNPQIGTFDRCVQMIGNVGAFSNPGDSGSFILGSDSGRAVALLFAGDGTNTFACDMTAVCTRFQVVPA